MGKRDQTTTSDDGPLDLSALDPDRDRAAEERLVSAVMGGRRQSYPLQRDLLLSVWATDRRVMVGVAAAAAMLLVVVERSTRPSSQRPVTVAQSIGVPPLFLSASTRTTQEVP